MDETLSEKEQLEEIKAWWKENGAYVLAGLVLGIVGIMGFNQWKSSKLDAQLEASALFESLADNVSENRFEPAIAIAADIYSNYPETVYADEARLAMARLFMDRGRDQDAADELRSLLTVGSHVEIQHIGRLRLAKILLHQNKPQEVLTLLEGRSDSAFVARYYEVIGDAHFALRQFLEAEIAYQAAITDPRAAQLLDTALVQMKINDLPDVLAQATGADDAPTADETPESADLQSTEKIEDAAAETGSADDEETGE